MYLPRAVLVTGLTRGYPFSHKTKKHEHYTYLAGCDVGIGVAGNGESVMLPGVGDGVGKGAAVDPASLRVRLQYGTGQECSPQTVRNRRSNDRRMFCARVFVMIHLYVEWCNAIGYNVLPVHLRAILCFNA